MCFILVIKCAYHVHFFVLELPSGHRLCGRGADFADMSRRDELRRQVQLLAEHRASLSQLKRKFSESVRDSGTTRSGRRDLRAKVLSKIIVDVDGFNATSELALRIVLSKFAVKKRRRNLGAG